jgi:hypothetical protein
VSMEWEEVRKLELDSSDRNSSMSEERESTSRSIWTRFNAAKWLKKVDKMCAKFENGNSVIVIMFPANIQ